MHNKFLRDKLSAAETSAVSKGSHSDELWQKVVVLKIRKIPISAETQLSAAAVCVKHITYEWALRFIIKWTQYYFEGVFLI